MRMSPGNERIMIVSADGLDKRQRNPSKKPRKTPAIVNVSRRLFRREPQKPPRRYINQGDRLDLMDYTLTFPVEVV